MSLHLFVFVSVFGTSGRMHAANDTSCQQRGKSERGYPFFVEQNKGKMNMPQTQF